MKLTTIQIIFFLNSIKNNLIHYTVTKNIKLHSTLLIFTLFPILVHGIESTLEIRTAAFYHTSHLYREVYENVTPSYQVEVSFSCNPCCYAWWANFAWLHDSGHPITNSCSSVIPTCSFCTINPTTKVNVANLTLGIRFPYYFTDCFIGYFAIGPSFGRVWYKNTYPHPLPPTVRTSQFTYGGIIKLGFYYYFAQCLFLDFFTDYLYQAARINHHTVNLSGFEAGIGLGLRF